jgi:hypothetical protein
MDDERYREASINTAINLKSIAHSSAIRDLSSLTLPEIDAVVDRVAQMVPAGNVPAMILNGLARMSERKPPAKTIRRDINLLFKGVEQALDKAMVGALFAGPAAVIWGYQNMLRIVGKDIDSAFPEGTWQFYVDYALREDTARHTSETNGFDITLNQYNIRLSQIDRMTAWVMTAIHALHQYNALLENEWRERVTLYALREITAKEKDAEKYAGVYRAWEKQRPYGRGADCAPNETYPAYRHRKFEQFVEDCTKHLRAPLRRKWREQVRAAETGELLAYQRQMSIVAYLEPAAYGETRMAIPATHARIGLIYQGHYYLIPACTPGTSRPLDANMARSMIANIVNNPVTERAQSLTGLARIRRSAIATLREKFDTTLRTELKSLWLAPILLNFDQRSSRLPLSELRQAERGVGDHAMTIFDTGETFAFDQSHIFFDGAWGTALAEILTNEAISWASYLNSLPAAKVASTRPYSPTFAFSPAEMQAIQNAPTVTPEVGVETTKIDLEAAQSARKLLQRRSSQIVLTINDLLVLYRAIHAVTYQPNPQLIAALKPHARKSAAYQVALSTIQDQTTASILIPVDASQRCPKDRLYPMTFEVPLVELDLLNLYQQVLAALDVYKRTLGQDRAARYDEFETLQRSFLATLAGFGVVLSRSKEIAITGESTSVGIIKLMAHIPIPLQRLLDRIPGRFDMLNDLIKGREVLSNVGAVVPGSSLTRFSTAKDDNDKKTLVWGVMTDAAGTMHISLRDFRPHVAMLEQAGQRDLAVRIAQDYLDAYASGFNEFIKNLHRIAAVSRETFFRLERS